MATFNQAINEMANGNNDNLSVIARAVCDELHISYASDEAERLGDWLAMGAYYGNETPATIAAEWRAN